MAIETSPIVSREVDSTISRLKNARRLVPRPLSPVSNAFDADKKRVQLIVPATPAQQAIYKDTSASQWLVTPLALPTGATDNIQKVQFTWQAVAAHNPILRTTITAAGPEPALVVLQDVAPLAPCAGECAPFHSLADSVLPHLVYTTAEGAPTVTLHIPRMLVDEVSLSLIQEDFTAFYSGKAFAEHAPYAEYLANVANKNAEDAEAYWKSVLADVENDPSLFHGAEAGAPFSPASYDVTLGSELLEALVNFEFKTGFDRSIILQAAWALVVAQHQSREDVVFAATVRDDLQVGQQSVVGHMEVMFPLRVQAHADSKLLDVLENLENALVSGTDNAFVGYDEIVKHSKHDNLKVQSSLKIVEGTDSILPFAHGDSFPVSVCVNITDVIHLTLQCDSTISPAKVRVLLDHCHGALQSILQAGPETTVGQLDLVGPDERAFLLRQAAPKQPPRETLVHGLFEKQAALSPNKIALEDENGRTMTYAQLNATANQIARHLPCGPGSIVPVCIDRSEAISLIISLLAVLKSGAAYVILDPDYPIERQRFIADDVSAPFVLTLQRYAERFSHATLTIERLVEENQSFSTENLLISVSPQSAAYVIYTSGSTGVPKGVILEHGAATSGLLSAPKVEGVRSLLFYNPVFSASQRTIFGTLTQGGCLCLASKESLTVRLAETLTKLDVNTIGVTSTTAALLTPESAKSLKRMTFIGEKVSSAVVDTWVGKVDVRVGYGLSECTQLNWTSALGTARAPNNIGRPSDTTQSYVLVPGTTRLAPLMVPGELCLAGPQLARSYLNRPDETTKAFVPNPFAPGRLYRTGDMAVCLEDGSVEILGRIDLQVKIAGQRIEPSEVAAVIRMHASVDAASVVAVNLGDEVTLVACLVLGPSVGGWTKDLASELREAASRALPSFAVPSFWLPFDILPTNSNGKIDFPALRRHIEGLGREGLVQLSQFSSSRTTNEELTDQERALLQIWASVLDIDISMIHSDDSFLALGGSSIRAIKLATECRELGWEVAVADIIRSKSLKDLATCLTEVAPSQELAPYKPFSLLNQSSSEFDQFEDVYPSSPLQESLVAASLAGIPDYLYQRVYDINGVNVDRLKAALDTVYQRRAILRTTFLASGPTFVQAVMKRALPWNERSESLEAYKDSDAQRGVALGESFIRFGFLPKQSLLVVTTHHALFDYWSNTFVLDDAAAIYKGGSPLPRTPYSSFIRNLQSVDAEASRKFWGEYLSGASTSRLGITPSQKHVIETKLQIDPKPFLAANSVTSGALIYAAWALVLAVHNASDDVTFATALSGRDVPVDQVQSMDGPALTTVPQRVDVNRTKIALDFVRAVQDGLWDMNKHSQYGMRNALRASGQSSNLFDTLVNLLVQKQDDAQATKEVFRPYGPRPAWNTEYITLEALVEDDSFNFRLISDLQVERANFVLEQFVNAIAAIVAQPNAALGELEIMSRAEHAFLENISPRIHSHTTAGYMHAPLEHIARTMPERIAVQWQSSESVSYQELNSRANRLAVILREKGVGPDVIVPLCLDKSVSMIVSMLGVLKAGGAYAPMDPENPPERNSFIVSDVEAKIVLTGSDHAEIFTAMGVEVVFVEDLDLSGSWPDVPVPDLTTDNLAYIIYTSGSTGLPKGVLISHSAVSVAIQSIIEREQCDKTWRTLLFSNYVFDVSVSDIFTALGCGATLCVAPTAALLSNLAECITTMGVTQLFLTPTVAKLISPEDVPAVTKLILGGEPLTSDLMTTWAPKVHLMNGYGPTEAAIFVMMANVPAGSNARIIGPPLRTVSAVILDKGDGLRPVPYGAIGELCVSGPQLARGYLKRPEVNAKAFVEYQGERLYRTGDLARWLPDGQIECFGRKDNQVKISGHRIELGEIEAAILATNKVFNCVVAVVEMQGKPQLAAFVIINSQDDAKDVILPPNSYADEIMSISTGLSSLPPYMVPKLWIPVSRFPLMPSGKADRRKLGGMVKSLDALELSRYTSGGGEDSGEFVAPETDEEKLHQEMWSTVLGVDKEIISATASFFSFGGDSISAINLVSQCRRAGYALPVGDVLAFPVLKEMATRMKPISDATKSVQSAIVYEVDASVYEELEGRGVNRDDIEAILPSGPGQAEFRVLGNEEEQFWMLHAVRPIPNDLDFNRWQELTVRLTEKNAILRTSYVMDKNGSWLQVVLRKAVLDVETIHVQDEAEMQRVIDEDWNRLFDIGKPFVRYRLLVLPDGRRNLMIKLDHGSYDGTLLRVFDSQFTAMAKGQPLEEPVAFNSFVDHVTRLDKSKTLAFWRQMLEGSDFKYPVECTRPNVTDLIMRKTDRRVDAYASQCGVTVPIVFQTAFTALLSRLSGRTDVSYDNLVTGRDVDMQDTQLINGTCANFIPFRCSFGASTTVKELLKETQSLFWKTNEHGTVSITDIFADQGLAREDVANKCLFLFQPFEPASGPVDHMRWLVMALSKVTQPVNYALMFEVFKTALGYNLRIKYDGRVYNGEDINAIGDGLISIIEGMMAHSSAPVVEILASA